MCTGSGARMDFMSRYRYKSYNSLLSESAPLQEHQTLHHPKNCRPDVLLRYMSLEYVANRDVAEDSGTKTLNLSMTENRSLSIFKPLFATWTGNARF